MTYTQNKSKKLWKNKNMCHLYIYIYIYSNSAPSLLQFPISAMPLPKSNNIFFIFLLFRQCHCHKPIATIFFSSYFDNAIATNSFLQFFPLYFGNAIATNQLQQFFFPPISAIPLPQIHSTFFFFFWEMIYAHNFYNIFTTNSKWQVVIYSGSTCD